ncbi:oligosaccharide flippase family protein, partial [Candidatus Bathyarchaeota archaeon]|nr:oligosaccharide flippase family protein [Candidatus Bathyarchaeota archaeon]
MHKMSRKLIIKNFLFYLSPSIVSIIGGLIVFPLLTKNLSAEEYGLYSNLIILSSFLAIVFGFNLQSGLSNLIYKRRQKTEEVKDFVWTTFICYNIIFFLISPLLFFLFNYLNNLLFEGELRLIHQIAVIISVYVVFLRNSIFEYFRYIRNAKTLASFDIFKSLFQVIFFITMGLLLHISLRI